MHDPQRMLQEALTISVEASGFSAFSPAMSPAMSPSTSSMPIAASEASSDSTALLEATLAHDPRPPAAAYAALPSLRTVPTLALHSVAPEDWPPRCGSSALSLAVEAARPRRQPSLHGAIESSSHTCTPTLTDASSGGIVRLQPAEWLDSPVETSTEPESASGKRVSRGATSRGLCGSGGFGDARAGGGRSPGTRHARGLRCIAVGAGSGRWMRGGLGRRLLKRVQRAVWCGV